MTNKINRKKQVSMTVEEDEQEEEDCPMNNFEDVSETPGIALTKFRALFLCIRASELSDQLKGNLRSKLLLLLHFSFL